MLLRAWQQPRCTPVRCAHPVPHSSLLCQRASPEPKANVSRGNRQQVHSPSAHAQLAENHRGEGQVFLFRESPCCDGQRPLQGPHLAPGKGPRSCCSVLLCSASPFGHLGGKWGGRRVLVSTGLVPPASSVSELSTKAGSTFSSGTPAEHAALLLPFPGPQPCTAQHLTEKPVPSIWEYGGHTSCLITQHNHVTKMHTSQTQNRYTT